MRTSSSQHISDLAWHLAFFNDVSGQKTSLGQSNDIELTLEVRVLSDLLARLLSNILEVVEYFSERWDADLDAMYLGTSSLGDLSVELDVSRVDASVT